MPVRDCQRGRVYAWENRIIAPRGRSLVPFASAQGMVDAIWAECQSARKRDPLSASNRDPSGPFVLRC